MVEEKDSKAVKGKVEVASKLERSVSEADCAGKMDDNEATCSRELLGDSSAKPWAFPDGRALLEPSPKVTAAGKLDKLDSWSIVPEV